MARKKRPSSKRSTRRSSNRLRRKRLLTEKLEFRRVLSGSPPLIEDVLISGQDWQDAFVLQLQVEGLGDGGFGLLAAGDQTLPWSNLDKLSVKFDQDVDVQVEDLHLQGVDTALTFLATLPGFSYDQDNFLATWTFDEPLPADRYAIRISDRVSNDMGEPLDAGDGGLLLQFDVVPGDVDANAVANLLDGLQLRLKLFAEPGEAEYDVRADLNGSGVIDLLDGLGLRINLFGEIPPGELDLTGPALSALLVNDTGPGGVPNTDFITSQAAFVGSVADPLGVASLLVAVDDGNFQPLAFDSAGAFSFDPGALNDGAHTLRLAARDQFGNLTRREIPFVLDTIANLSGGDLSTTSDTGVPGDQTTTAARVTLTGHAEAGAVVVLRETGQQSLVGGDGTFRLPGVNLQLGTNTFHLDLEDKAGNSTSSVVQIERLDAAFEQNAVLRWNREALEAIRRDATEPVEATRALAMVHAAIFDVINAIDAAPALYVSVEVSDPVSIDASVAAAARKILLDLYPGQKTQIEAAYAASVLSVPAGLERDRGELLGQTVGQAIIDLRSGDGWDGFDSFTGGSGIGNWRPTPPMFALPQSPYWRYVDTWVLDAADQFRPAGPPSLTSTEYAAAVNDVKQLGAASSAVRTADQTEIALFWLDGAGTYTPPGHWNEIAAARAVGRQ